MGREADIADKFWKSLGSDRTVMLGLVGVNEGHSQPMTALLDPEDENVVWFFSAKSVDTVKALGAGKPALLHFASRGHHVFATVHGRLVPDNDRGAIDRLWNRFVAAWYEGGKDDPELQLLRFEPGHAQIWLNENSVLAGIKLMLGRDPKKDYADKVAEVDVG